MIKNILSKSTTFVAALAISGTSVAQLPLVSESQSTAKNLANTGANIMIDAGGVLVTGVNEIEKVYGATIQTANELADCIKAAHTPVKPGSHKASQIVAGILFCPLKTTAKKVDAVVKMGQNVSNSVLFVPTELAQNAAKTSNGVSENLWQTLEKSHCSDVCVPGSWVPGVVSAVALKGLSQGLKYGANGVTLSIGAVNAGSKVIYHGVDTGLDIAQGQTVILLNHGVEGLKVAAQYGERAYNASVDAAIKASEVVVKEAQAAAEAAEKAAKEAAAQAERAAQEAIRLAKIAAEETDKAARAAAQAAADAAQVVATNAKIVADKAAQIAKEAYDHAVHCTIELAKLTKAAAEAAAQKSEELAKAIAMQIDMFVTMARDRAVELYNKSVELAKEAAKIAHDAAHQAAHVAHETAKYSVKLSKEIAQELSKAAKILAEKMQTLAVNTAKCAKEVTLKVYNFSKTAVIEVTKHVVLVADHVADQVCKIDKGLKKAVMSLFSPLFKGFTQADVNVDLLNFVKGQVRVVAVPADGDKSVEQIKVEASVVLQ